MSDYYYYRDGGKKTYGGKRAPKSADGYYGNNTAGDKRKFKGSNSAQYVFTRRGLGTLTVTATSFEEALRKAKSYGYSSKDYKASKRGK